MSGSLAKLRHHLHYHAELSSQEEKTKKIIKEFIANFNPSSVHELCSGKALLFSFDSSVPGPHVLFRADLDALPIEETLKLKYASRQHGVSHKCGHDGHMALVCSLAQSWWEIIESKRIGKLGLLFQHAEETGQGALEVVNDEYFKSWAPDYIFGFHNLPGVQELEGVLVQDVFACASQGLKIVVEGKTSHAAEPHLAISPAGILRPLLDFLESIQSPNQNDNFFLCTPVLLQVGEENYGITPGQGFFAFTLRSKRDEVLQKKKKIILEKFTELTRNSAMSYRWEARDVFPSTSNHQQTNKILANAFKASKMTLHEQGFPFKWSEDFGHYTRDYSGSYFGLGIGKQRPPLHDPLYDFNDNILERGKVLLKNILLEALKS